MKLITAVLKLLLNLNSFNLYKVSLKQTGSPSLLECFLIHGCYNASDAFNLFIGFLFMRDIINF